MQGSLEQICSVTNTDVGAISAGIGMGAGERATFLGVGRGDEVAVWVVADGDSERAGLSVGDGAGHKGRKGVLIARVAVEVPVVFGGPDNAFR